MNVFYIATATANIILKVPTVGFGFDLTNQVCNAAFCLFGLPFICAALYGVSYRQESHIRLYLYYLCLSFVLDMIYVIVFVFIEDTCKSLPNSFQAQGAAFACGMTRLISLIAIFLMAIIQGYSIFAIWSMAEDIRATGAGVGLPELLENHKAKGGKGSGYSGNSGSGTYSDGLFGTYGGGSVGGSVALNYGSLSAPTVGGGNGLFGGKHHEVNYPPVEAGNAV